MKKQILSSQKKLIELVGASEDQIEFVKDRPGHDRRYATNSSKAREELGWSTKYTFDEGFKMTMEWYAEHGDWVERCKSGEYQKYYEDNYGSK